MKVIRNNFSKIFLFGILILVPLNYQDYLVSVKAQSYTNISVRRAYSMINNNSLYPNLIVLDVRDQSEYNINHICNAILIPVTTLESRIDELKPYNNTEIIVYCSSGGRSASASQILIDYGFTKVYNMIGGITEWISLNYEICSTENGGSPSTIEFSFNIFLIIFLGVCTINIIFIIRRIKKKRI